MFVDEAGGIVNLIMYNEIKILSSCHCQFIKLNGREGDLWLVLEVELFWTNVLKHPST